MSRPPLPVGSWGRITRARLEPKVWVARARFRDDDGRTRKLEARGRSGNDAEHNLIRAMKRRRSATADEIGPQTRLAALADLWTRTEVEGSSRAINTRQRYAIVVTNHIVPGIGGLMVREATVPRLDRYVRAVAESSGPATAKLARTCLSGMLALAVRHGALAGNPMREVRVVGSPRGEVRALSLDEVAALRAALAGDRQAVSVQLPALVDVLLATGARIGEALAMRWEDVDVPGRSVALTGTVVRQTGSSGRASSLLRQDTTKGHRPRRLVLPPFALDVLAAQRSIGLDGGEHDLVFPSAVGTLREVATVERQWRGFRERHPQFEWVKLHTIRKTVATHIDRAHGTDAAAAQLGHSSPRVTSAHYVERAVLGPDLTDVLELFAPVSGGFAVGAPTEATSDGRPHVPEQGHRSRLRESNPGPTQSEPTPPDVSPEPPIAP